MTFQPWMHIFVCGIGLLGCVRTTKDIQRDYAKESLAPVAIRPTQTTDLPPKLVDPNNARPLTLRIYADRTYRHQQLHWEQQISAQVATASQLLTQQFGVRLQIASIEPWDRESKDADTLDQELTALHALDKGETVDWVIGFVSARPFTNNWHEMGQARMPGKHLVLRSMARLVERQRQEKVLDELSPEEREKLYQDRLKHKEVLVLLHELAHTLAVPHDPGDECIMSPVYQPKIAAFSERSEELLRLGLQWHGATDRPTQRKWQAAVAAVLAQHPQDFEQTSRAQLLAWSQGKGQDPMTAAPLTNRDVAILNEAIELLNRKDYLAAKRTLDPLVEREPNQNKALEVSCRVELNLQKTGARTLDRCQRACETGTEPAACLLAADALGIRAESERLDRLLTTAQERLEGRHAQFLNETTWLVDVRMQRDELAEALDLADQLGFSPEALQVRARLAEKFKSVGLPANALSRAQLNVYVRQFRAAQAEVARGEKRALLALVEAWPQLPGTLVLQCQYAAKHKPDVRARDLCEKAKRAAEAL